MGRYQIISPTLSGLVQQLELNPKQPYDQTTQDKLAVALLERRGAESYINQELTREEFAANLAKEWAALPRVLGGNPNSSYYAGDGLNQAHVKVDEIIQAIDAIKPQ